MDKKFDKDAAYAEIVARNDAFIKELKETTTEAERAKMIEDNNFGSDGFKKLER